MANGEFFSPENGADCLYINESAGVVKFGKYTIICEFKFPQSTFHDIKYED